MLYIERTNRVRNVVLGRPDLCERIRRTFEAHFEDRGEVEWLGKGNSRMAYEVGQCELPEGMLTLVLKLYKKDRMIGEKYSEVCPRGQWIAIREELGVFEVYYDFVSGRLDSLTFSSDENYAEYVAGLQEHPSLIAPKVIDLTSRWNGTFVERGDLGAVPYFQMVVRFKDYFGWLTEGNPALIAPRFTAQAERDDYTVEGGRIIDLSPSQCLLSEINHGREFNVADDLGLTARGNKYFGRHNRLDL